MTQGSVLHAGNHSQMVFNSMEYCLQCGNKIKEGDGFCQSCGQAVDTSLAPLAISKKEKVDHQWIPVTIGVLVMAVLIGTTMALNSSETQLTTTTPPLPPIPTGPTTPSPSPTPTPVSPSITNPDYLKDPSSYLVDYENKIISSPRGNFLWVEGIVDSHTLKVSYAVNKAGTQILKMETLPIPWLGDPIKKFSIGGIGTNKGQCWENGAKEFLRSNFLHTKVYLAATGWNSGSPSGDYYVLNYGDVPSGSGSGRLIYSFRLADYVIKNGYGIRALPSNISPLAVLRDSELYQRGLSKEPFLSNYSTALTDAEGVASLAKNGLWGTCQIEGLY